MNFPIPFFTKNHDAKEALPISPRLAKKDAIVWSIGMVILLLFSLLAWDGILFLRSLETPDLFIPPRAPKRPVTIQNIDQTIQLLDERKAEFEAILENIKKNATAKKEKHKRTR